MSKAFNFDAVTFVQPGHEADAGEFTDEDRQAIDALRAHYPELSHWGNLALSLAFGDFSQEFFLVSWAEWSLAKRDELFLSFCCWRQTRGAWRDGFDEKALSKASEWRAKAHPQA